MASRSRTRSNPSLRPLPETTSRSGSTPADSAPPTVCNAAAMSTVDIVSVPDSSVCPRTAAVARSTRANGTRSRSSTSGTEGRCAAMTVSPLARVRSAVTGTVSSRTGPRSGTAFTGPPPHAGSYPLRCWCSLRSSRDDLHDGAPLGAQGGRGGDELVLGDLADQPGQVVDQLGGAALLFQDGHPQGPAEHRVGVAEQVGGHSRLCAGQFARGQAVGGQPVELLVGRTQDLVHVAARR